MAILVEGDVGAKCCGELRDIYCRFGKLKELIEAMHNGCVAGKQPDFTEVEAIWLEMRESYDELERYILPIFGQDSAFRTKDDDSPTCPIS